MIRSILNILIPIIIGTNISGCSVIGLKIGEKYTTEESYKIEKIELNKNIKKYYGECEVYSNGSSKEYKSCSNDGGYKCVTENGRTKCDNDSLCYLKLIDYGNNTSNIICNEIDDIEVIEKNHLYSIIGFGIGLPIDILILYSTITAIQIGNKMSN